MMWGGGAMFWGGGGLFWFVILAAVLVIPFWKLLPRHGIAAPFALFAIIPLGALILLWIVAFRDETPGGRG